MTWRCSLNAGLSLVSAAVLTCATEPVVRLDQPVRNLFIHATLDGVTSARRR
jgi:hypothetical protein